ncbi:EcsC family protein [Halalkalibacter okhensis]|uniref:ABC transporter substrate-binding protein n=1 Tax=Halalkalibacter okhensis TaxID=333138 RepID=A0A0B0IGW7_9BACI|nr:EcsC family protein [Halalkalibacter okhensis]KHF39299.1 ABC transporter substrate-binding protein [Halalkalibacter okhensis]
MRKTDQLQIRLHEINEWEESFFSFEEADVKTTYSRWSEQVFDQLGEKRKQKWLTAIDTCLLHLQAWLHHSRSYEETKRRVISHARTFDPAISSIDDLQNLPLEQLDYLADQLMAKQRLLALGQGGLSGMGGAFLLLSDLPALAVIQLRSLQHLALVYGYDVRRPVELMNLLKLFYVATIPKSYQANEWDKLINEVEEQDRDHVFYSGDDAIMQDAIFEQLTKQLVKAFVITMFKKKLIQGVPLVGMAVGAGMNYRFSQQVIEVGQHFYQKRRLLEEL